MRTINAEALREIIRYEQDCYGRRIMRTDKTYVTVLEDNSIKRKAVEDDDKERMLKIAEDRWVESHEWLRMAMASILGIEEKDDG